MFSFNSRGKRLKNGNVEISAIASIVCEKAKKNKKIRECFPCLLWRAHSSIQIRLLLLALLRADNHIHNDRRAELCTGQFHTKSERASSTVLAARKRSLREGKARKGRDECGGRCKKIKSMLKNILEEGKI